MMDELLLALVKHTLKNCPKCHGTGELVMGLGIGNPLMYSQCEWCKDLRSSYNLAKDPA